MGDFMIINQNLSMFPIIDFSPLFYLKKEEDYKVHKPYDKYFKRIIDISGEGLLELIGFPIKIKHIHDSEKINEISGELHIDKLIESEDGKMYIIEFQKRPMTKKDLRRFGSYQSLVYKQTGKETIVIVISLSAKEDSDNLWGYGEFFERNSLKENNFQNDLEHYKSNNIDLYWLNIEYGFTPHVKSLTSMNFAKFKYY